MKFFKHFIVLITTVSLLFGSCKTDFELTTDWKDITIVYGMLNTNDSAQYIRVSKAFLDAKTSALSVAMIPDSGYYKNLQVKLEELDINNNVTRTLTLTRVDGALEGYPKEAGVFSYPLNYLYKTSATLNPDAAYRLVVIKNDNQSVTAVTGVVNNLIVVRPRSTDAIPMLPGSKSTYTVSWRNTYDATFYGLVVRFNYQEFPAGSPRDSVAKFIEWPVFLSHVPPDGTISAISEYQIFTDEFYGILATKIGANNNVNRIARSFDFKFAAGAKDLYNYYNVATAQSGITQGQIQPTYTNLSEGYGVFSSRVFSNVNKVPIRLSTVDSIACNSRTHQLNFLNSQKQLCQ